MSGHYIEGQLKCCSKHFWMELFSCLWRFPYSSLNLHPLLSGSLQSPVHSCTGKVCLWGKQRL